MQLRHVQCLLVLFLTAGVACSRASHVIAGSPAETRLGAISAALQSGGVGTVEIVQIPARIQTRGQITQEMLESAYHNKVIIRDITGAGYYRDIQNSFKSLSVVPGDGSDLRWGVIFYSRSSARLGAVYFDKWGRHGYVDEFPVSFSGDFFSWLERTFSKSLQ